MRRHPRRNRLGHRVRPDHGAIVATRRRARSAPTATSEGRARFARNGTRHDLNGPFRLLSGEDVAAFARLLADLAARRAPRGDAGHHWVDEVARCQWHQLRLFAPEDAAMTAPLEAGDPDPRLPSLATLARYRARVERDLRLARAQLEEARASRPRLPDRLAAATVAEHLRWLLARPEEREAAAAAPEDRGTPEPEPAPAATAATAEPAPPPPLNRQQRRRLEALKR